MKYTNLLRGRAHLQFLCVQHNQRFFLFGSFKSSGKWIEMVDFCLRSYAALIPRKNMRFKYYFHGNECLRCQVPWPSNNIVAKQRPFCRPNHALAAMIITLFVHFGCDCILWWPMCFVPVKWTISDFHRVIRVQQTITWINAIEMNLSHIVARNKNKDAKTNKSPALCLFINFASSIYFATIVFLSRSSWANGL